MQSVRFFDQKSLTQSAGFDYKLLIDIFSIYLNRHSEELPGLFMFTYRSNTIELQSNQACPNCSTYVTLVIDYETLCVRSLIKKPDCPIKSQLNSVLLDFKSPSGKLVFLNNPSPFLKVERDDRHSLSINSTLGCVKESEAYADHNVGLFFVGNTMPYIMQNDNHILVTSFNEEDDDDIAKFSTYTDHGYLCTDLWWYTVLDSQLYLELCEKKGVDPDSIEHIIVETNKPTFTVEHDLTAHREGHHHGIFSKITY